MTKNMQKHKWARSAYTLTCLVSSNLILSQAFLTNALASEAVNDLIQSSDKIKNSVDGNNAVGSDSPKQTDGSNPTGSTAPEPPVSSPAVDNTPQPPVSSPAVDSTPQPPISSPAVDSTPQPPVNHGFSHDTSTQQTSVGNASRRVRSRQHSNSRTAGSGSPKQIDGGSVENVSSKVPAVKKLNFTDVAFGILAPGNQQSQGRYVHLYQFEGRENQLVQVRLVGSNDDRPTNNLSLKPYLILLDPNNQVVSRKSSEGTDGQLQHAFIPARLPMKGTYTVAVTSEKPGAIGRYSLALREDRGSYALDQSGVLSSRSITSQLDESAKNSELQAKDSSSELSPKVAALQPDASSAKNSELQAKDSSSELSPKVAALQSNASSSKPFELQGKKDQLVNIRVDSTTEQFHPYAVLMNSKAQVIAMSEPTDSKYSASIDRAMLPQDDKYYVVVNSSTPQMHGKYRLTVY